MMRQQEGSQQSPWSSQISANTPHWLQALGGRLFLSVPRWIERRRGCPLGNQPGGRQPLVPQASIGQRRISIFYSWGPRLRAQCCSQHRAGQLIAQVALLSIVGITAGRRQSSALCHGNSRISTSRKPTERLVLPAQETARRIEQARWDAGKAVHTRRGPKSRGVRATQTAVIRVLPRCWGGPRCRDEEREQRSEGLRQGAAAQRLTCRGWSR